MPFDQISIWAAVHFFPQNDFVFGTSDSIKAVNINRCSSWQADKDRLMYSANDTEFAAFTE